MFLFLVKRVSREGKAIGSEEGKSLGSKEGTELVSELCYEYMR
jgi:hypothetical protein